MADKYLGVEYPKDWATWPENKKEQWRANIRARNISRRPKTEEDIINDPDMAAGAVKKPSAPNITVNVGTTQPPINAQEVAGGIKKQLAKDQIGRIADAYNMKYGSAIEETGGVWDNVFAKKIKTMKNPKASEKWGKFYDRVTTLPKQNRPAAIRVFLHDFIPFLQEEDPEFAEFLKQDEEE